jgi:hypothetical protein
MTWYHVMTSHDMASCPDVAAYPDMAQTAHVHDRMVQVELASMYMCWRWRDLTLVERFLTPPWYISCFLSRPEMAATDCDNAFWRDSYLPIIDDADLHQTRFPLALHY